MMHENIPKLEKGPVKLTVDLSGAWDKQSIWETILSEIKKYGFYKPDLLYRGMNGDVLREEGFEEDFIHCSTEEELIEDDSLSESALDYAFEHDGEPLFLVYDGSKLKRAGSMYEYEPKEGLTLDDALVAILNFK